jgi:hypothetical protein
MVARDPVGADVFDHLRELSEYHPDHAVTVEIIRAVFRAADGFQDGAPDAGPVAHACTRIAALAGEMLRDLEVTDVEPATGRLVLRRTRSGWHLDYTDTDKAVQVSARVGTPRVPLAFELVTDPADVVRHLGNLADGCTLSIELEPLS